MYDESNLPYPFLQVPAGLALLGFSLLTVIILAVLCRGRHRRYKKGFYEAFAAPYPLYLLGVAAGAACLVAAAVFVYSEFEEDIRLLTSPSGLSLVLGGISIAAAVSMVLIGVRCYRGGVEKQYSGAILTPAYACCFWLVSAYHDRSADPLVIEYVYIIIAIGSILLALYFMSAISFDRPRAGRTAFFSLLSIYFIGVTLADGHEMSELLLLVGFGLYLLTSVAVLLKNDSKPEGNSSRRVPRTDAAPDSFSQPETEGLTDE